MVTSVRSSTSIIIAMACVACSVAGGVWGAGGGCGARAGVWGAPGGGGACYVIRVRGPFH